MGLSSSRPARALWIEINYENGKTNIPESRPARALWIEISNMWAVASFAIVEAREGLVD